MKTPLCALACLLCAAPVRGTDAPVAEEAKRIHGRSLVFDAHVHMINRQFHRGGDIGDRHPDGQVDLPRLREGGVDALFFTLFVTEEYYPARHETRQTLRLADLALRQIEGNADVIELALDASEVERIVDAGRIAAVLDLEGGFDLDGDLGVLRSLHRLGFRALMLPAHNRTNGFADSCCDARKWNGLNEHGREVIQEMNRLGMVINVSHASDETMEQTIDLSSDPVLATHHGLRSFNDIPRVMPERLLKKLAAKGGLIGFHIGHSFHSPRYHAWRTEHEGRVFWDTEDVERKVSQMSILEIDRLEVEKHPMVGPKPPDELLMSVDEWLDVVDHAIALVGEDHVMLGTDFDGGPTPPRGMRDVRDLPLITEAMLRRGYFEERVRKFLGGNLLRVFRMVTER
jgi:membrane dipeptidase